MEAGVPARQSGIISPPNPDSGRFDAHHQHQQPSHHRHRDSFDRSRRDASTMAAAALISPSTPYHPHHPPPFSSSGFHHGSTGSIPGMISPVESRRTSDDNEHPPHRQSLPSIQEVIGQKQVTYPPPAPSTLSAAQSLPSPFSSSTPTRPFADAGEKHPSPRTLHPASSFPRTETLPAFADPSRPPPPPSARPPPLTAFPRPHPSPPARLEPTRQEQAPPPQREAEQRQPEGPPLSSGFHHHPPGPQPAQAPQVPYPPPVQLPPGQLPLSAGYPVSPRHTGPSLPSLYNTPRPPLHPDDHIDFGRQRNNKLEATLTRHFEGWGYTEALARIGTSARTLFNFAEAYATVAREEHSSHPLPTRLPTEREVNEMIANVDWIRSMLEAVRNTIESSNMANERAREQSRPKGSYEDEDVTMYGDGMKAPYSAPSTGGSSIGEVKKRRGRAAPPGRCHSCNRMDTPEWRRGPDGARTLCNACGLHYAKLERKRQLENKSRGKPAEEPRVS